MRSVSPKDYESLPRLGASAGYICVIRDIDSDTFRIDSTDHPATFVKAIVDERARDFGIELVSILEAEDLNASATTLYDRHHARLSEAWHTLDEYQLAELRRSILQIDAHRSLYLTSESMRPQGSHEPTLAIPRTEERYGRLMTSNIGASGRPLWREQRRPHRPRGAKPSARNGARAQQFDLGQYLRDRFLTLLTDHPFKVIAALSLLLVLGLLFGLIYGYHVTQNAYWR